MFNLKPTAVKSELEVVRTNLIAQLETHAADSDEYQKVMAHLDTLSKHIDAAKLEKLNVNTIAIITGNVVIAGMVLWHERDNVLTTKMLPFLNKAKS